MTELTKYDEACRLIAEAASVDEVKSFHDEAKAMAAYARQATEQRSRGARSRNSNACHAPHWRDDASAKADGGTGSTGKALQMGYRKNPINS